MFLRRALFKITFHKNSWFSVCLFSNYIFVFFKNDELEFYRYVCAIVIFLTNIDKHEHFYFSLKWNLSKCTLDFKRPAAVEYAPVGWNQVREKEWEPQFVRIGERPEIAPAFRLASEPASYGYLADGLRHSAPGSDTKAFITPSTVGSVNFMSASVCLQQTLGPHHGLRGKMVFGKMLQMQRMCIRAEEPKVREPRPFLRGLLANLPIFYGEGDIFLIIPGSKQIFPLLQRGTISLLKGCIVYFTDILEKIVPNKLSVRGLS